MITGCKIKKVVFMIMMLCCVSLNHVFGDHYNLVTLSTIKARALGIGGAFVSIYDDLASLDFNPAAFSISTSSEKIQGSIFLNPLGPILILENRGRYSDWTTPFSYIFRGAALSFGRLDIGLLWGEEMVNTESNLNRNGIFDASNYEWQHNASLGFSLSLAPKISLGMAGEFFFRDAKNKDIRFGHRYGIILQPRSNLTFGLCYFDMPDDHKTDRMLLERIGDETLNIGVSYKPWEPVTLILDVRNVSDEGKGAVREPHMGIEIIPIKHVALRGGHYRDRENNENTYSLGLGFLDWNSILHKERSFSHPTFSLNTTVLWQRSDQLINRWFFLSCILRI